MAIHGCDCFQELQRTAAVDSSAQAEETVESHVDLVLRDIV